MNIRKILTVLLLNCIFLTPVWAGKKSKQTFSLQAQILGPTELGLYADYQINERVRIDFALGKESDIQFGATYMIIRKQPQIFWYPFFGVQFCSIKRTSAYNSGVNRTYALYFPVGLRFQGKGNLIFALEAGYNWVAEDFRQQNTHPYLAAIRLGFYLN